MPYSHYPNGFPNGVAISDFAIPNYVSEKSNVYWVDSNVGSNGNKGTINAPFATLDYAIGRCTANNGDIINVAPYHSETLTSAAAVNADIAGIRIIGYGEGNNRPTFTFTTSTAATFAVNAADVYISNLRFLAGIANQTILLDINAARALIVNNQFAQSGQSGLTAIDINGGAANACDGVVIAGNEFDLPGTNWDRAIELGEVADNVQIINNDIYGDFDDAGIHNITAKVLTNLLISDNTVRNLQAGQHAIELVSACTGRLEYNSLYADAYATTLDPGSLFCVENYAGNAIDTSGALIPAGADETVVVRTAANLPQTASSAIFTIAGGPIEILNIVGEVTTVIQNQANNTKLVAVPTVGSTTDLCAVTDIANNAVGTFYNITGTLANALVAAANGTAISQAGRVVVPAGTINLSCAASNTGQVRWYLRYKPLSTGVTVTAA